MKQSNKIKSILSVTLILLLLSTTVFASTSKTSTETISPKEGHRVVAGYTVPIEAQMTYGGSSINIEMAFLIDVRSWFAPQHKAEILEAVKSKFGPSIATDVNNQFEKKENPEDLLEKKILYDDKRKQYIVISGGTSNFIDVSIFRAGIEVDNNIKNYARSDRELIYPEGSKHMEDNSVILPNNVRISPEKVIKYSDGSVNTNGETVYPDGSITVEDGSITFTDGSVEKYRIKKGYGLLAGYIVPINPIMGYGSSSSNKEMGFSANMLTNAHAAQKNEIADAIESKFGPQHVYDILVYISTKKDRFYDLPRKLIYMEDRDQYIVISSGKGDVIGVTVWRPGISVYEPISNFSIGDTEYPKGSTSSADGTVTMPGGAVARPDGYTTYADGPIHHVEQRLSHVDGTTVTNDMTHHLDGSVTSIDHRNSNGTWDQIIRIETRKWQFGR